MTVLNCVIVLHNNALTLKISSRGTSKESDLSTETWITLKVYENAESILSQTRKLFWQGSAQDHAGSLRPFRYFLSRMGRCYANPPRHIFVSRPSSYQIQMPFSAARQGQLKLHPRRTISEDQLLQIVMIHSILG